MNMIYKKNIILEKEVSVGKKYCALKFDDNEEVLDFEVNMLQNNPSLAFLDVEVRQINESKKVVFSIESKVSLSEYLQNNDFQIDKFLGIVEGIFNNLISMKEYMLDNRKVMLDSKNIFLEKNNLVAYMIYLPIQLENTKEVENEFTELCKEIFKDIKKYKNVITLIEKKLVSSLISNKSSFEKIEELFNEYKLKSTEKLSIQDRNNEKFDNYDYEEDLSQDEEIYEEAVYIPKTNKKILKKEDNKKSSFSSVIEEDYKKFDDFDEEDLEDEEDEKVQYDEYKDIKKYEKQLNKDKMKRLLILQLIVVMTIGSLGLIISKDEKSIFLIIAGVMVILVLLFTFLIFGNDLKGKE